MAAKPQTSPHALLGLVLSSVSRGTGSARVLGPVWREVAGPTLARVSAPERWSGSTLVIRCASSAWAAELERQADLLTRMQQTLGSKSIQALVFEAP